MAKFKIKTGDLVQVISGSKDNKGKQGKVLRVIPETSKVVVEGINVVTRHRKASMQGEAGGIQKVEAPILDMIQSRLPIENFAARVWLYESIIRFDEVETPA